MLTLGPLTRHAEDLMPVTRIIAGPDGIDEYCVPRELGDPADTDFATLRVLVVDDASLIPARKELRDARDRAADALRQLGARTEQVSLKQLRRALEIYLAALGVGASVSLGELLTGAGVELQGSRHWVDAARGRGDHTLPVLITAALERLNRHMPEARIRKAVEAARALREEMKGILGEDGARGCSPPPRCSTCSACRSPRSRSASIQKGSRSASRSPPPTATTTSRSRPRSRSSDASEGGSHRPDGGMLVQEGPGPHRDARVRGAPLEGTDQYRPGTSG
jgi:hypothetical protein